MGKFFGKNFGVAEFEEIFVVGFLVENFVENWDEKIQILYLSSPKKKFARKELRKFTFDVRNRLVFCVFFADWDWGDFCERQNCRIF